MSGARDPPPDPLTDGALEGAVGASSPCPDGAVGPAGITPCGKQPLQASHRALKSARSTAIRSAPTSSRLAAMAASASVVTRRAICSSDEAIEDSSDNSDEARALWCHRVIIAHLRPRLGGASNRPDTLRPCFDASTFVAARPEHDGRTSPT